MVKIQATFDLVIIGGGPAGIAAACAASENSASICVIDDNPGLGGQIWRGKETQSSSPQSSEWFERFRRAKNIHVMRGTRVFAVSSERALLAETSDGVIEVGYEKLILAAGARERFVPFPGWTLPNVIGAGGLQALVKSGLSVEDRRVVVAGSGPLLLAVAAFLIEHGAKVPVIAEQASWVKLARLGVSLVKNIGKSAQAMSLRRQTRAANFVPNCFPVEARGSQRVQSVVLKRGSRKFVIDCDYVACGFHLVPNVELAMLLECDLIDNTVKVNELQETSRRGIFSAGEATGIGGVELALAEGEIAGYAATENLTRARNRFSARARALKFATALNRAFELRSELKSLARSDTLVCRCEDVPFGLMQGFNNWRDAKLQTRSGMGPCQGRICGPAAEFLFGWRLESVRPPIFPVTVESLCSNRMRCDIGTYRTINHWIQKRLRNG